MNQNPEKKNMIGKLLKVFTSNSICGYVILNILGMQKCMNA